MRQRGIVFLSTTVRTDPDSRTGLPCCLYAYLTGITTYARSPVTSTCHGVPMVTYPSVMPFCLASTSYAFDQSVQAVGPVHVCGGKSSMIDAGKAHAATML